MQVTDRTIARRRPRSPKSVTNGGTERSAAPELCFRRTVRRSQRAIPRCSRNRSMSCIRCAVVFLDRSAPRFGRQWAAPAAPGDATRRTFLIRNGRLRRPPTVSSSSRWPVGLPTSSALDEPPPSGLVRPGPGRYPFAPQPSRWTAAGNLVTMTPPAPLGAPSRWPHAPSPTTPPAARSLGPRGRSNTDYTCHDSSNRVSRATANSATVSGVTTSA